MAEQTPLVEQCQTPEDENCSGQTEPCPPGTFYFVETWVTATGAAGIVAIRNDPQGVIRVTGDVSGAGSALDFGNGLVVNDDDFVVELDDEGAVVSLAPWGSPGSPQVAPGPATSFVSPGGESGLLSIVSTFPARAYQTSFAGLPIAEWSIGNAPGTPGQPDTCHSFIYQNNIEETSLDLIVTGLYRNTLTIDGVSYNTGAAEHDLVLARLTDPLGTASYVKTIVTNKTANAATALTPDGDVVMLALVSGPVVIEGVEVAPSGAGYFLARFDGMTGVRTFSKWFPATASTNGCSVSSHRVAVLPDGGILAMMSASQVVIEGVPHDGVFSVARFDPDGDVVWARPVTNAINQSANIYGASLFTSDDSVYWLADVNGILDYGGGSVGAWSQDSDTDPVIARFDLATGALVWTQHISMDGQISGGATTLDGGLVIGGYLKGSAVIGGVPINVGTSNAGWLAKLTP